MPRLAVLVLLSTACAGVGPLPAVERATSAPEYAMQSSTSAVRRAAAPARGVLTDAERVLGLRWRFAAGAAIVGVPAVGPDGGVFLGTVEGYLHALAADGTFRWSYTLSGPVLAAPVVDERGAAIVATSKPRLHAIAADGTADWTFVAPARATGVTLGHQGNVFFGARDEMLYAVGAHGGGRWSAELYGMPTAGPIAAPNGDVIVGTLHGRVLRLRGVLERTKHVVGDPVRGLALAADGTVFAVAGTRLVALAQSGSEAWSLQGARFAPVVTEDGVLVVGEADELVRLSHDGSVLGRVPLPVAPSAEPVLAPGGLAWVPSESGELVAIARSGRVERRVVVSGAALGRAVVDEARGQLVTTSGATCAAVALAVDAP